MDSFHSVHNSPISKGILGLWMQSFPFHWGSFHGLTSLKDIFTILNSVYFFHVRLFRILQAKDEVYIFGLSSFDSLGSVNLQGKKESGCVRSPSRYQFHYSTHSNLSWSYKLKENRELVDSACISKPTSNSVHFIQKGSFLILHSF